MSRFSYHIASEWPECFGSGAFNWRTFTFIRADVEIVNFMGDVSVELGLIGFRATVTYRYNPRAPLRQELEQQTRELLDNALIAVKRDEYDAFRAWRDAQ